MPILRVELVASSDWARPSDLAARIANGVALALSSPPQSVWVRVSAIAPAEYAENGGGADTPAPIFVTILEREPPTGDALEQEVADLTRAISEACGRPESSVHLIYDAPGRGRVAFGGRLVS